MANLLVIDDERGIRNTLKDIIEYEGYDVAVAEDGPSALKVMEKQAFDLVFCDIKMPHMDGLEVLEKIKANYEDTQVVMISGHGDIDTAVESIKKGAFDFIQKPIDLNRLLITMKNGLEKTDLITETKILKKKISGQKKMIGDSEPLSHIRDMIQRVAPSDARVMITGENGTGKEVVARLLHDNSSRAKNPFIEVNCAAIPSELIESELFGHEKGAFTSAIKQRKGKFEQADGGTIFLDEIGDMSLNAQAKVLRALQESVITRVGSDKNIKVNVRVIAATNKNLRNEIDANNFREDLYHRLSVILIHVPPLRERRDDIPLLVKYFNEMVSGELGLAAKIFEETAINELQELPWTGNIRELRNVVERVLILCEGKITKEDIQRYAMPLA